MKAIKTISATIAVVILLLAGALAFAGLTKTGTQAALSLVMPLVNSDNLKVEITEPGPFLSGKLTASHVAVADSEGTWLEIDGLDVIWSPADLLKGIFKADSVTAATVHVDRRPQSTQSDSGSSSIPLGFDVSNIALPVITLGENISGKEERLTLKGGLALNREKALADLALTDLNRGQAEVEVKLVYDVAGNQLNIDATAREANGGFVSSLLQLPGNPALLLNIRGAGPLNNWKGEAHGALEGVEVVSFTGSYATPQTGENIVTLQGGGALDALLPPAFSPLFKGRTKVDLAARIEPNQTVSIRQGYLETGAIVADIAGTYSPEGQNDLKAEIRATSGLADFNFLTENGGWRAFLKQVDIAVSGPAQSSRIAINAAIGKLQLGGGEVGDIAFTANADSFDLRSQKGKISAALSAEESRFENENLDRLVQAPLKLEAPAEVDGNLLKVEEARLQSASIGGTASGQYDLTASNVDAKFTLFAAPTVFPASVRENLTETTRIEGSLNLAGGNLEIPDLAINSQLLTAKGSASLIDGALEAALSGALPDLGVWRKDLKGTAEIAAKLTGSPGQPEGSVEISIEKSAVSDLELLDFSASFSGAVAEGSPHASARIEGVLNGQSIQATADLQQDDSGQYQIPDIRAEAGKNQITGAVTLSTELEPKGQFRFDLPDLALISAIAGQDISGNLKGAATLDQIDGALALKIDAEGETLSAGTATISAPRAHIETQGVLVSGTIEAVAIAAGENRLEEPKLTFRREGETVHFGFGGQYDNAPATASGTIQVGEKTEIRLEKLGVKPRGIAIALQRPAGMTIANSTVIVNEAALTLGGGTLNIKGSADKNLALRAELKAIPAKLANTFSPTLGADGAISGNIQVSGEPANPVVDYELKLANGSVAATRKAGIGGLGVAARGKYQQESLSLTLALRGPAALAIDGGGNINTASNTLSLRFSGPLPASLLNGTTARQGMFFSGVANSDLSVSGSMAGPEFGGLISLDNVGVDLVRQNMSIRGVKGEIKLAGGNATIVGVTGNFTGGGSYSASGKIGLSSAAPADLTISLNGVRYTDGNLVSANLGGEVRITGNLSQSPAIAGTIDIAEANITIPETLPTSIASIKLKHKNAPADVNRQYAEISTQNTGDGSQASAYLDLTIRAPGRIFVRGRGMDAELGGTVKISGTTANPVVSGGFEMLRGRLSLLGKRLDFTSGQIGFGGGLIPNLDLVATTRSGSTTIIIKVSGPANDPSFTFSSSPSLPEDEVLAQLIFQKSSSSLSPFQIAQLADAVAQLTGAQNDSIFTKLRKASGFDDLDVTSDDQGNAEVTAGKYLNSKTYIELQQNTGTGSGKAIINLDVGKGLKLRGEADSDGEGAAGIFYEKEY